jgi:hypothetical protein
MKKFQQICAVVILAITLVIPAFAGDMGCPGATCEMSTQATSTVVNPLVEIALGFLLNVSSLF